MPTDVRSSPGSEFVVGGLTGVIISIIAVKVFGKRPAGKRYVPDGTVLPDTVLHVVYEYGNLVYSGQFILSSSGGPVGVHIGDVFLLNCRKFGDFFDSRPTNRPDVRAVHFCSISQLPRIRLPLYNQWRPVMDKNLAHISYDRVTDPIVFYDGDNSKVALLLQELQEAFRLFLKHVDDEYKSKFQSELEACSTKLRIPLP